MQEDARKLLGSALNVADDSFSCAMMSTRAFADDEQKHISGALSKCIKHQLKPMYKDVMAVTGKGSIAIQKVGVHCVSSDHWPLILSTILKAKVKSELRDCAERIYEEVTKKIMYSLDNIALDASEHLNYELRKTGKRVSVAFTGPNLFGSNS